MNIRPLLSLALLSSVLLLSACGNKGPLLPPPAPGDEEWPDETAGGQAGPADAMDADADADADADPDDATGPADDDADVDGDGPDAAGDDGDGDA